MMTSFYPLHLLRLLIPLHCLSVTLTSAVVPLPLGLNRSTNALSSLSVLRSGSSSACCHSGSGACCSVTLGYTFDVCTYDRICASPRYCVNKHSYRGCTYGSGEECHCVPLVMIPCARADHCPQPFETCAYLPGQTPYCYSSLTVEVNNTFNYYYYNPTCCGDNPSPKPSYHPPPPSPSKSSEPPPKPSKSMVPSMTYSDPPDPTYTVPSPSYEPSPVTVPPPPPKRSPKPSYSSRPRPSEKPKPSTNGPSSPSPSNMPITLVPVPSHIPKHPEQSHDFYYSASPTPSPGGLSGDSCNPDIPKSCKGFRECSRPKTCPSQDCNGVCIWSTLCTCTSDCYHGEICVSSNTDEDLRFCYSPFRVVDIPWVKVHHCAESGMVGDGCIDDSYCKGGRKCVQGGRSECLQGLSQCGLDRPTCDPKSPFDCYCSGARFCSCKDGCEDSEVCCDTPYGHVCLSRNSVAKNVTLLECPVTVNVTKPNPSDNSTTTTYQAPKGQLYALGDPLDVGSGGRSPSNVPRSSPSLATDAGPSGTVTAVSTVCVDAKALAHLPRDQLIFSQHQRASVLCDQFGSCATPGHMVIYHGRPMMMMSYCKLQTTCARRTMYVNSPRYRRRMMVDSNTEHLKFTALAARFELATEELLLSTAVHIGL